MKRLIPEAKGNPNTSEYMDELYSTRTEKMDRKLTWLFPHLKKIVDRMPEGSSIMEIGCGTGTTIMEMHSWRPDHKYVGLDLSEEAINIAKSKAHTEGNNYLNEAIGFFADNIVDPEIIKPKQHVNAIDMICSFQTLEHVDDPSKVIRQMKAMCKPGGLVVNSVPRPKSSLARVKNHVWEIGQKDFEKILGGPTKKITEGSRIIVIWEKPIE